MSAIKPSAEHMEQAEDLLRLADAKWSGSIERTTVLATALAEAEARGRKAAFEEAAKEADVRAKEASRNAEQVGISDAAVRAWRLTEAVLDGFAATIRTLAAKES